MPVAPAPLASATVPITVADFLRLAEAGAFGGNRVELIDGRVIFRMAQGRLHAATVALLTDAFYDLKKRAIYHRSQATVVLSETRAPDPDVFLTRENPVTSTKRITGEDLLLAVEVSVTTLLEDRTEKARLYAEAGVPEYWIVNPVARQVEVRREPVGTEYASVVVYGEDEAVSPLVAPDLILPVASLLPAPDPA